MAWFGPLLAGGADLLAAPALEVNLEQDFSQQPDRQLPPKWMAGDVIWSPFLPPDPTTIWFGFHTEFYQPDRSRPKGWTAGDTVMHYQEVISVELAATVPTWMLDFTQPAMVIRDVTEGAMLEPVGRFIPGRGTPFGTIIA